MALLNFNLEKSQEERAETVNPCHALAHDAVGEAVCKG